MTRQRANTHTAEPLSRAAAAHVGNVAVARPAVVPVQKQEQESPIEDLPTQLQPVGAFSPPPPVNGINSGNIQPFQLKTGTGIVQKVATFTRGNKPLPIQEVHALLIENIDWYYDTVEEDDTSLLEDFAADTDTAYDVTDLDTLSDDLYEYCDSFEEEDYDDDGYDDDDDDDHDSRLDKHDRLALEYHEEQDKNRKKDKPPRKKAAPRADPSLSWTEDEREIMDNEGKDVSNLLEGIEKKENEGGMHGQLFLMATKIAARGFDSLGIKSKGTKYATVLSYSSEVITLHAPQNLEVGNPAAGYANVYGLIPTERGDFTKLQYAILHDVLYETGKTAVLVEWKAWDNDANKAQAAKINGLMNMLATFGKTAKGSLTFLATVNDVAEFGNATLLNYLIDAEQHPVLSGGEPFDKEVFDKGKKFWNHHSKAKGEDQRTRKESGLPFLVVWFNRSNVEAQYNEEDSTDDKAQHLREMRHKTNVATMSRIVRSYADGYRVVLAGDKGADAAEMGIVPIMDLRENWKLPGYKTILSQDEVFDQLAMISGQELLHIGFRSGRLESLVMQPKQKVIMLENSLSTIGNARAKRYYTYSQRGAVFSPTGYLRTLHVDPGTLELAKHLKEEDRQVDEANARERALARQEGRRPQIEQQPFGVPHLPVDIKKEHEKNSYNEYLEGLDQVKTAVESGEALHADEGDESLIILVEQMIEQIAKILGDQKVDWSMNITGPLRAKAVNALKAAFYNLINDHKDMIIRQLADVAYMPRAVEIKTIGDVIFKTIKKYINTVDTSEIADLAALGGAMVLRADLFKRISKIESDVAFNLIKKGLMQVLALKAHVDAASNNNNAAE